MFSAALAAFRRRIRFFLGMPSVLPAASPKTTQQKKASCTGARIKGVLTAMLRREPTRIEMKSEDLEEFDRFQAQQKKAAKAEEAGAPEPKQDDARKAAREDRIGLRSDSY